MANDAHFETKIADPALAGRGYTAFLFQYCVRHTPPDPAAYAAMAERPADLHIFARGGDGFDLVRLGQPADPWLDQFGDWLASRRAPKAIRKEPIP